jgi:tetratricopeptide (TPR) repeat protein
VAKVLKTQKRTGFDSLIKGAAIRSNNRNQLYNLLSPIYKKENKTIDLENEIKDQEISEPTISKEVNSLDKILEQNIYTNIIGTELVNELEELNENKEEELNENKEEKLTTYDEVIDQNSEFTFERWLYKSKPENKSFKERSVDDVLKSLENRNKNKPKKDFFSAEVTADKSLEEKPTMNTETLAEIYVKQGNYPKAISIYEQLMLSNPEKKLFFASRINFINQKTKL